MTIRREDSDGAVVTGSHGSRRRCRASGGGDLDNFKQESFSKSDLFLFSAKVPIHDSVAIIDTKATRLFLESSSLYRQNEIYTGDFFAKVL